MPKVTPVESGDHRVVRCDREIQRAGENEGISPYVRESFEPILSQAGVCASIPRAVTLPITATAASETPRASRLTVTDKWVLFARPRSQHVVLQDIDQLRRFAAMKNVQ